MATNKVKHVCFGCKVSLRDVRQYRFVGPRKPTASVVYFCKSCAANRADIAPAIRQKVG